MSKRKKRMVLFSVLWWMTLAVISVFICQTLYNDLALLNLKPDELVLEQKKFLIMYIVLTAGTVATCIVMIPVQRMRHMSRRKKIIYGMALSILITTITIMIIVIKIAKARPLIYLSLIVVCSLLNAFLANVSLNFGRWTVTAIDDIREAGLKELLGFEQTTDEEEK